MENRAQLHPASTQAPLAFYSEFPSNWDLTSNGATSPYPQTLMMSVQYFHSPLYYQQLYANQIQHNEMFASLCQLFSEYNIPIGMLSKLQMLSNYQLHFIIDDSASMRKPSDVLLKEAKYICYKSYHANNLMSRWQEVEERLHILMEILSFVPTKKITISFLNRDNKIIISREKRQYTPQAFRQYIHEQITAMFSQLPEGGTPIYQILKKHFQQAKSATKCFLFTDGVPSDNLDKIESLILNRHKPKKYPLTILSCTDNDKDINWAKNIEAKAKYVAEIDDFESEYQEVRRHQGSLFPFTKGWWLLCQLVADINPHDLDALDEKKPFTKKTLNELLGRMLSLEEYRSYFDSHPATLSIKDLFSEYARDDIISKMIRPKEVRLRNAEAYYYFTQQCGLLFPPIPRPRVLPGSENLPTSTTNNQLTKQSYPLTMFQAAPVQNITPDPSTINYQANKPT